MVCGQVCLQKLTQKNHVFKSDWTTYSKYYNHSSLNKQQNWFNKIITNCWFSPIIGLVLKQQTLIIWINKLAYLSPTPTNFGAWSPIGGAPKIGVLGRGGGREVLLASEAIPRSASGGGQARDRQCDVQALGKRSVAHAIRRYVCRICMHDITSVSQSCGPVPLIME